MKKGIKKKLPRWWVELNCHRIPAKLKVFRHKVYEGWPRMQALDAAFLNGLWSFLDFILTDREKIYTWRKYLKEEQQKQKLLKMLPAPEKK